MLAGSGMIESVKGDSLQSNDFLSRHIVGAIKNDSIADQESGRHGLTGQGHVAHSPLAS